MKSLGGRGHGWVRVVKARTARFLQGDVQGVPLWLGRGLDEPGPSKLTKSLGGCGQMRLQSPRTGSSRNGYVRRSCSSS